MKAYAKTHVGNVRSVNEDAFYLPQKGERFAAIADGMGGHLAGEVASAMAIQALAEYLRGRKVNEETLYHAVASANAAVYMEAKRDPLKHGMGTTLTVLHIEKGLACLAHVGDSRAYLLRKRALMQMSNDHSLVNELVERGELTPSEAMNHPQRNYITRTVGTGKKVDPDIIRLDHQKGDVWLLCSDGLSNYLRQPELAEVLMRANLSWEARLDVLVDMALERGGGDNVTALIALGEEVDAK